jgi:hypothetical protein
MRIFSVAVGVCLLALPLAEATAQTSLETVTIDARAAAKPFPISRSRV